MPLGTQKSVSLVNPDYNNDEDDEYEDDYEDDDYEDDDYEDDDDSREDEEDDLTDDEREIVNAALNIGINRANIEIIPLGRFVMSANAKTFCAPFVDETGKLKLTNSEYVFLIDSSNSGLIFAVHHKRKQKRYYLTEIGGGQPLLKPIKKKHGTVLEAEDWLRLKGRL